MYKYRNGVSKQTPHNLMIGPGAIYTGFDMKDFDPSDPSTFGRLMGATSGGNTVKLETERFAPPIDGTLGKVKGTSWLIEAVATLETNLLEITKENLLEKFPEFAINKLDENYDIMSHTGEIAKTEYNNIAIVGEITGLKHPVIIVLENAQVSDETELELGTGEDEVVLPITFEGYYDPEDATRIPLHILYPRGTSPVSKPVITPPGGKYEEPQMVSITSDAGADIYYTTDGTTPYPNSAATMEYTGPFEIDETTTVKAIAYKDAAASEVSTNQYIID